MKSKSLVVLTATALCCMATATHAVIKSPSTTPATLDRSKLPIKEPSYPAITELDARNAKAPPRFQVKAPDGAPNVLVILIDDQGFGVSSAFGGAVQEPALDKLASEGLKYKNFNTTAL